MTLPNVIVAGRTHAPQTISQDGYEVRVLVDVQVLTLVLGVGFTWLHPCPKCHRGIMPCCNHCAGEGHSESCLSAEASAIRKRLQSYEVGK